MVDIDDTDDPVHGQQELALFNAHYDCTCFQPILIFDGLSGKPILSLLHPGKRPSGEVVAKVQRHDIRCIRKHWPCVDILVRVDSRYCSEPALTRLEAIRCDYINCFAINSKLDIMGIAAPWRAQCDLRRSRWMPTVRRFRARAGRPTSSGCFYVGTYWLLHTPRLVAPKRSRWRGATFDTLRCMFVKVAVCKSAVHGPSSCRRDAPLAT